MDFPQSSSQKQDIPPDCPQKQEATQSSLKTRDTPQKRIRYMAYGFAVDFEFLADYAQKHGLCPEGADNVNFQEKVFRATVRILHRIRRSNFFTVYVSKTGLASPCFAMGTNSTEDLMRRARAPSNVKRLRDALGISEDIKPKWYAIIP
ncbi:hypothetical protein OBBRIDRAFT_799650 [Obba rivulosa]|uniref:Uncharacterized protein n=1 Tax=Obba rivulosa TaxID=1052685 RepID=A0A8E2AK12_9APHY|nr:hypothetical protein OBBRIDRAFT_799650 [Obba rivulosa]